MRNWTGPLHTGYETPPYSAKAHIKTPPSSHLHGCNTTCSRNVHLMHFCNAVGPFFSWILIFDFSAGNESFHMAALFVPLWTQNQSNANYVFCFTMNLHVSMLYENWIFAIICFHTDEIRSDYRRGPFVVPAVQDAIRLLRLIKSMKPLHIKYLSAYHVGSFRWRNNVLE